MLNWLIHLLGGWTDSEVDDLLDHTEALRRIENKLDLLSLRYAHPEWVQTPEPTKEKEEQKEQLRPINRRRNFAAMQREFEAKERADLRKIQIEVQAQVNQTEEYWRNKSAENQSN